jgi:Sulfotransferase domain
VTGEPIVVLWSAPRCRSTAFARMMIERGDFEVVHEPFSHAVDFGESNVGHRTVHDQHEVMVALRELAAEVPVFVKDTTDFRYGDLLADVDFLRRCRHSFLIREPAAAIASHARLNPALGRDEIGFAWLHEIYLRVVETTGQRPAILDSDDLLRDPVAAVRAYCATMAIPFRGDALTWQPGMPPQWARSARWHTDAADSTGFHSGRTGPPAVHIARHPVLGAFYRHHLPHYQTLHELRLHCPPGQ